MSRNLAILVAVGVALAGVLGSGCDVFDTAPGEDCTNQGKCFVGGNCIDPGATAFDDPCMICQPGLTKIALVAMVCSGEQVCQAGVCVGGSPDADTTDAADADAAETDIQLEVGPELPDTTPDAAEPQPDAADVAEPQPDAAEPTPDTAETQDADQSAPDVADADGADAAPDAADVQAETSPADAAGDGDAADPG